MRPTAPDLMLPPEDPEQTPADTRLAREIRSALRGPMHALRVDLATAMSEKLEALEGRMCTALVEAVTRSKVIRDLDDRVSRLEDHCFKTEPAPPPDGGE